MDKRKLQLLIVLLIPIPWIVVKFLNIHISVIWHTFLSGITIVSASFLISWAAEVAQLDISESLAVIIIALLAVLPEYAVDGYFAWAAAKDPSYMHFASANMTGSNRLLIGVGWALVVFIFFFATKFKEKTIKLEKEVSIDSLFLLLPTIYAIVPILKGKLDIFDSIVFIFLFIGYVYFIMKVPTQEVELEGVPSLFKDLNKGKRRLYTLLMFLFAGFSIFISAEPFADGLIEIGKMFKIDQFILVQWIAPLASEAPELIVAFIFATKSRQSAALGTLISSKVNQWTLLIGTLPLIYSISLGHIGYIHLDARQQEEVLLTAAQSFFALMVIIDLKMNVVEAFFLFLLFALQFFIPSEHARILLSYFYIGLGIIILFIRHKALKNLLLPFSYLKQKSKT